jgi:hypothetical protein
MLQAATTPWQPATFEQIAGTVAAKLKTETWRQPVLTPAVIKPHNRMLIDP